VLTIIITFLAFGHGIGQMIAPEMYREISPPGLGYVFVPDDDTFINSDQFLEITFVQTGPEQPVKATAWITHNQSGEGAEPLDFQPVLFQARQTNKWIAVLPPLPQKGDRWFYWITIDTSEGRIIEIRKHMNWFEELFSGFKERTQLFWVTYEGNVIREMIYGKVLLTTHIVLAFGSLLFMFHTLYYILSILAKPLPIFFIKAYKTAFWAIVTFAFGTIVLGIPITRITFGAGFMPWPTQGLLSYGDITDTKSTQLIFWWAVLLFAFWRDYKTAFQANASVSRMKAFSIWTIAALILTVIVFLIPHSQFMQSN
jgi:hypothetical protein